MVAKEHGHRPTTMLSVYAAWTEGAVEPDITAIRDAMNCTTVTEPDTKRLMVGPDPRQTRRRRLERLPHVRTDGRAHVEPTS